MRIVDLQEVTGTRESASDVCIVGAGAAGLYLADALSRRGREVVVLEAGGKTCSDGASIGIEPVVRGSGYAAATEGRAFGLGGTTSRWGGLLIPHTESDHRATDRDSVAWRSILDVVEARRATAASRLGGAGDDFGVVAERMLGNSIRGLRDCGLRALASERLPFGKRNFAHFASGTRVRRSNVTLYLHAVATGWKIEDYRGSARITSAVARSRSGAVLNIAARYFVIAAGALESPRILLEIDGLHGNRVFPRRAAIGRYLSDHLSSPIATVSEMDWKRAVLLFAPRFVRGRMRSVRFVEAKPSEETPRYFTHVILDINSVGFRIIKEILFSLQAKRVPRLAGSHFPRAVADIGLFAYYRYGKSSLFIPPGTPIRLQLDIEQVPRRENGVRLGDQTDAYGRPVPVIDWGIADEDHRNIRTVARRFVDRWPGPSHGLPRVESHIRGAADDVRPYQVYHPVGTTRMGVDEEAVVNRDLQVLGTENLFVLSTGVFPSAGTANPTFSMLCLGEDLADRLSQQLSR